MPQVSFQPPFRVYVKSRGNPVERMPENPAPEGRTNLAQRFSAGEKTGEMTSPRGTAQFSFTLFRGAAFSLPHYLRRRLLRNCLAVVQDAQPVHQPQ
jgi:hypothetical protein